ncbi:family 2A encapsulin nanocompartment cargo protein cysteine desulfurase [Paludibacterium yongneupense]|uniref:family 2A encapsulin nanocompartment cargo protein cysteine desulfurase n=1 Tax=Paludibacterium yongneupense TaxID=400061 RepID=UPI000423EC15|nr:family 2A encapsulin nanocompartment cargo protein cysteine desulfurase [Paludibacterium yongneupense]
MTTPDSSAGVLALAPATEAPDAGLIEQLANQLFQSSFAQGPTAHAAPLAEPAAEWQAPTTLDLQAIPAGLVRSLALVPPSRGGGLPSPAASQAPLEQARTASGPSTADSPGVGQVPAFWPLEGAQVPFPSQVPAVPAAPEAHAGPSGQATTGHGYGFLNASPQAPRAATPAAITAPSALSLDPQLVPDLTRGRREAFDARAVRRDFPILQERVHGKPLIWLDNGATTQKPQAVIDRISAFYEHENSNIHRAAHTLAARATDAYEAARDKVRRFIGAGSSNEVIFVRGATEGINLVAKSWGAQNIGRDDEIVVSWLEHHANIVPWQQLCAETGARLRVIPVDDSGQILLDEYERLLNAKTRLVAVTMVSNALGTVTPIEEIVAIAHRHGATTLVDAAQSVSHMKVDVRAIDCDFLVFSGHKMFGPTGIGVVYGKAGILEETRPWQGGGNMIADVTFERTSYQAAPNKFEAGTGNIADAVGLGAAIDYLDRFGMDTINRYEHGLLEYATEGLLRIPGLRLIGTAKEKAGVLSFVLEGWRTEDVGRELDREGIAVRSGHHCAQPILRRFGVESTVRPSLALYNTFDDIDALVNAVRRLAGAR